jgi:hypothetical protein
MGGVNDFLRLLPAAGLPANAAADEFQEAILQRVVRFPDFAGVGVVKVLPDLGVAHAVLPIGIEIAVVQLVHGMGEPTGNVDAVGDVADGDLLFDAPRPEVRPHAPRDVAMKRADRVGPPRKLQADHGHAKWLVLVLRLDAAQAH